MLAEPGWSCHDSFGVLVFGDRDEATVGNLQDGEVLENYINKIVDERGIYYPDPHLSKWL